MTAKLIALSAITALLLIPAPAVAQEGAVLTAPGVQKLTLGGELRFRMEDRDGNGKDATSHTNRFRLYMDAKVNDRVSAFVESQYVNSGSELNDSEGEADLYQAYGKVANLFDAADLQFGRFKMKYGNGRIFGDNWWHHTARSFDGLRANLKVEGHKLDVFRVRPADGFAPAVGNIEQTLTGFYFENESEMFNYDAYLVDTNFDAGEGFMTYGALLDGNNMGFAWNLEYAMQNHDDNGEDGEMLVFDANYDMGDGLKLGFGYENYDENWERMHMLGHCYSGWQDIVRFENYRDFILKASMPVMDGWKGFVEFHNFDANETTGNYAGGQSAGFTGTDLGREIDVFFKGKLGKRAGVMLGASRFMPGDDAADQTDQDWLFLQFTMKF